MKILENIKSKLAIFVGFICELFPFAADSGQQKMKDASFYGIFLFIHPENI